MRKCENCDDYHTRKVRAVIHEGTCQSPHNGRNGAIVVSAGVTSICLRWQLPWYRWSIFIDDLFTRAMDACVSIAVGDWLCWFTSLYRSGLLLESSREPRIGSLPWLVTSVPWSVYSQDRSGGGITDQTNDLITARYPPQTNAYSEPFDSAPMSVLRHRAVPLCGPQPNPRSSSLISQQQPVPPVPKICLDGRHVSGHWSRRNDPHIGQSTSKRSGLS